MANTIEMIQARIAVLQDELRQAEMVRAQAAQTAMGLQGAINELDRLRAELSLSDVDEPLPAESSADKIWKPSSVID